MPLDLTGGPGRLDVATVAAGVKVAVEVVPLETAAYSGGHDTLPNPLSTFLRQGINISLSQSQSVIDA